LGATGFIPVFALLIGVLKKSDNRKEDEAFAILYLNYHGLISFFQKML
jgi:hypothetical protein